MSLRAHSTAPAAGMQPPAALWTPKSDEPTVSINIRPDHRMRRDKWYCWRGQRLGGKHAGKVPSAARGNALKSIYAFSASMDKARIAGGALLGLVGCAVCLLLHLLRQAAAPSQTPLLLVLSLDAFKPDFLLRPQMRNLRRLGKADLARAHSVP